MSSAKRTVGFFSVCPRSIALYCAAKGRRARPQSVSPGQVLARLRAQTSCLQTLRDLRDGLIFVENVPGFPVCSHPIAI